MPESRLADDSVFVVKSQKGYRARNALFDASVELIAANGVNGFSVGELCDHAGLKRTSFYSYFSSLEDMIDELSLREDESFESRFIEDYGEIEDGVHGVCGCLLKFYAVVRDNQLWCQFCMRMYAEHAMTTQRMRAHYKGFVQLGIEQGRFRIHESEIDTYVGLILSAQNLVVEEALAKHTSTDFELRLIRMVLRAGNADEGILDEVLSMKQRKTSYTKGDK